MMIDTDLALLAVAAWAVFLAAICAAVRGDKR